MKTLQGPVGKLETVQHVFGLIYWPLVLKWLMVFFLCTFER